MYLLVHVVGSRLLKTLTNLELAKHLHNAKCHTVHLTSIFNAYLKLLIALMCAYFIFFFPRHSQLTIPLVTVTSITKERTALVIPNAILITTTAEKVSN